ncbi:RlmE family RNA methyltransferase [Thermodesulforhabdus norvegica]|uniref:Ribosomal RNA large subunit methyltransferase E n=1 Tax=Thermodesulforhabdus norvegica TaxID=39841 RepID=A0A1I4REB4_9BACT|nr:RlmE family RNA methyltransferase [Thermodesulforhabdus norvegica]SFM50559.1 23S rRNA (uridine2552-2'-O)-methyltransferase [Thermodesulforhabdus norvegica]
MAQPRYQDHFFKRAKQEGYFSRAVYKLIEIDKKYGLIRKGMRVLDLGAAPGSWLQWTSRRVGSSGLVVGVDLQPVSGNFPENTIFVTGDVMDDSLINNIIERWAPFDIVLSDMAPFTTGNKYADSARSALLAERAIEVARLALGQGGHILLKIFQGSDFPAILSILKKEFASVKTVKPKASRKESKEVYILGMKKIIREV